MQRLPSHLLDRVLADVVDNADVPVSRNRTACLLVNKLAPRNPADIPQSFYLAAIPTLYKAPSVRLLDSFFAATSPAPAGDVAEISASDLVDTGHFKLAGLRYVRKLHIDSSRMYDPSADEDDLQMSDEQRRQLIAEEEEIRVAQFLRAEASLRALPPKAMSDLYSIQVGEVEYQHPGSAPSVYWTDTRLCQLIPVLAQTLQPEVWCQSRRRAGYLTLNPSAALMTPAFIPVPGIINHVNIFDDFDIWPGRTNYLYIHEDSREILEKGVMFYATQEREEVDAEDVCHWLEEVVVRAFPQLESSTQESRMSIPPGDEPEAGEGREDESDPPIPREVCERTKIIIGGVALPTPKGPRPAGHNDAQGEEADRKQTEEEVIRYVQRYLRALFANCVGLRDDIDRVRHIEVKKTVDMPPCPSCAMHL